jgi:putative hydrolase of the HAD superfamily
MAQPHPIRAESKPINPHPQWDAVAGVVLDAVGTLICPSPSVAEAYTAAARRQGVALATEDVRARFQASFQSDEIHAGSGLLSTDELTEWRRWRRIVMRVLPEVADPERAFFELWDHFSRPDSWSTFPEVATALRELSALGVSICVGSNFDARLRGVVRGLPELAEWADSLVISSEVGYRKPHPSFFHAACARLGLPPEKVLCVGDDVENDVRGAINAGLRGVLLDRAAHKPRDVPHVPNLTVLVQSTQRRA